MIQHMVKALTKLAYKDDCPAAAWMLLAELSHRIKVDAECAAQAWDKLELSRSDDRIPVYISKILANRSDALSADVRNELKAKMGRQIKQNT